jgi:hypothetical protein
MASATVQTLDEKINRIRRHTGRRGDHPDERSLLHGYIACLSFEELCLTIIRTIAEPSDLRLPLRGRLLRLLREGSLRDLDRAQLLDLVDRSRTLGRADVKIRSAVDALFSALFEYLPLPEQQSVLDAWIGRGTRGAAARWLKATKEIPQLFDEAIALTYWRSSGDARAAKSLAYQASEPFLRNMIAELLERCEEGWIISKAVMRARAVDEAVWSGIRERHPATYLYLCARMCRDISNSEALDLVCACSNAPMNETRGLAIWAVGQMGLIDVLDQIVDRASELREKDMVDYGLFTEKLI